MNAVEERTTRSTKIQAVTFDLPTPLGVLLADFCPAKERFTTRRVKKFYSEAVDNFLFH